ncbi:hypothetical protein AB4Y32_16065 [Paraburkholderia phymatum]|uniref:Uncharacterized protein n=1 Tax=Paraburkholderia phymatum TaxID=148447 RepID=A0ACC6U127_9BURK
MSDQIRQLEKDRDYWKRVAAYLASCHAATLSYDGSLKSTSKARRERFESIVEKARDMMDGKDWRAGGSYALATPENAIKHCDSALSQFSKEAK